MFTLNYTVRACQMVFEMAVTILLSHRQCTRVLGAPHSEKHLVATVRNETICTFSFFESCFLVSDFLWNQLIGLWSFYAAGLSHVSGELWLSIFRNEELGGFNYPP